MADLLIKCSGCSAPLAVDDASVGQVIECPNCRTQVSVPPPRVFFRCANSGCNAELAAPIILIGEKFNCPNCETALTVPTHRFPPSSTPTVMPLSASGTASEPQEQRKPRLARRCSACGKTVAQTSVECCPLCGGDLQTGRLWAPPASPASVEPTRQPNGRLCPVCKSAIAFNAVVCVNCGTNLITGRKYGESRSASIGSTERSQKSFRLDTSNGWGCGQVIIGVILVAWFMLVKSGWVEKHFGADKKPAEATKVEAKAQPVGTQQPPSDLPNEASKLDDDQSYGYIKVKQDQASVPSEKVALLESYIQKHPKGRHIGEAMALLEDARKKNIEWDRQQTVATLMVKCIVTLGNGSTIPVRGWVQVIRNKETADKVKKLRAEFKPVGYEANDVFIISQTGEALRKCVEGGEVVASGQLENGMIVVKDVAPDFYFVFGAGRAGRNFIGIWGAVYAAAGQTENVSVTTYGSLLPSNDYEENQYLSILKNAWKPLNGGN